MRISGTFKDKGQKKHSNCFFFFSPTCSFEQNSNVLCIINAKCAIALSLPHLLGQDKNVPNRKVRPAESFCLGRPIIRNVSAPDHCQCFKACQAAQNAVLHVGKKETIS